MTQVSDAMLVDTPMEPEVKYSKNSRPVCDPVLYRTLVVHFIYLQ